MAFGKVEKDTVRNAILTVEQEEILDLYIENLDKFLEAIKESEKLQVKIETLHLKRILEK